MRRRPPSQVADRCASWLALAAIVLEIVGTFLPWLSSGTAQRNSYAAGGALRQLLATSGPLDGLLAVWPALPLVGAAAVAAVLLGRQVIGAALAAIAAAAGLAAAIAALTAAPSGYAHVVFIGPSVTVSGATVLALTLTVRGCFRTRSDGNV